MSCEWPGFVYFMHVCVVVVELCVRGCDVGNEVVWKCLCVGGFFPLLSHKQIHNLVHRVKF